VSAVVQHENARKVLRIIQAADSEGRPLNYQTLAAELGRDPVKHARAMAQVCDLLDAAAAQAGIPLLALVKVFNSAGVINPMAWTKNTPPGVRDAIIERSSAHNFSSADFAAIEHGLAALEGFGNRAAWLKVREAVPEDQLYRRLTEPQTVSGPEPVSRQFDDALDDIGSDVTDRVVVSGTRYMRDPQVRAAVVARSQGLCEYCNAAGFLRADGSAYVETHHIIALANDGADRVTNVIALCAGHHREAHFGALRDELEQEFVTIVKRNAGP
jgi:hypothetical protein